MESTTSTLTAEAVEQRKRDMMRRLGDDIVRAISIGNVSPHLTLADLTGTADQRESD